MKRLALALLLIAAPAPAATLWVAPGPQAGSGICTQANPCSLAYANRTAVAGDVVRLLPGTYNSLRDTIGSWRSGSSYAAPIRFVGATALTDASVDSFIVRGINLNDKAFVQVEGVRAPDLDMDADTQRCRLTYLHLTNGLQITDSDFCFVGYSRVDSVIAGRTVALQQAVSILRGDTLRALRVTAGLMSATNDIVFYMNGVRAARVDSCQMTGTQGSGLDARGRYAFDVDSSTFSDNRLTLEWAAANNGEQFLTQWRSGSIDNVIVRDTVFGGINSDPAFGRQLQLGATTGTEGDPNRNTFRECYYVVNGDAIRHSGNTSGMVVDSCVFYCTTLQVAGRMTNVRMHHNTIFQTGDTDLTFFDHLSNSGLDFRYNLVVGTDAEIGEGVAILGGGMTGATVDNNLYWNKDASPDADSTFIIRFGGQTCDPPTQPNFWCNLGFDCNSRSQDPLFSSTTLATLDLRPQSGSVAVATLLWPNGYVGALRSSAQSSPGTDVIRPGPIANLRTLEVHPTTVVLGWTEVGDDSLVGVAATDSIKYVYGAGFAANDATWLPAPVGRVLTTQLQGAGTPRQHFTTTLPAATNDTTLTFAMRTYDDAGNRSAISDTAVAAIPDCVRPGPITNLTVTAATYQRLQIQWSSVGDDSLENGDTPPVYEVVISETPINTNPDVSEWLAGTLDERRVYQGSVGASGVPGAVDSATVPPINGLLRQGTPYYVAVRPLAQFDGPSDPRCWSTVQYGLADTASGVTTAQAAGASARPAPISDLTAVARGRGAVELEWSAVGDDSLIGTATSYEVRYATSSITTNAHHDAAASFATSLVPAPPGTKQTVVVTGLATNTQYWFSVKTIDDEGNKSAIPSNLPVTATTGRRSGFFWWWPFRSQDGGAL